MKTNTPVMSFSSGEELDCRPIYLGRDASDSSYWFYALKGNTARFLKYVNYFHWDRGPQAVLELEPIPKEIEEELGQFLEGQVAYDFIKKRKNSKEFTVRKSYRNPCELSDQAPETETDTGGPGVPDVGRTGDGHSDSGRAHESVVPKRRRRLGTGDAVPATLLSGESKLVVAKLVISEPVVEPKPAKKAREKMKLEQPTSGSQEPLVTLEPQRRGPSSKVQEELGHIKRRTNATSDILEEEKSEKDHRVELGQLGLLIPKRKLGRPRKVQLGA